MENKLGMRGLAFLLMMGACSGVQASEFREIDYPSDLKKASCQELRDSLNLTTSFIEGRRNKNMGYSNGVIYSEKDFEESLFYAGRYFAILMELKDRNNCEYVAYTMNN